VIDGHLSLACRSKCHFASAATCMRTMRSGLVTAPLFASGPFLILSTASMPDTTSPITVYWPLRLGASANMMKNWELAEVGLEARAMPTLPRLDDTSEYLAVQLG